ncbi:MAG TPA: DUF4440 domain-containing protein, partial [Acidimicrobiia bacterium]
MRTDMTHDFTATLEGFDRAFRGGDVDAFAAMLASDAVFLLHQQPPLVGADGITETFRELFSLVDTSAYEVTYDLMEVFGDRAYVLGSFTEVLRPRDGGPATYVNGRIVLFWRRDDDEWRLVRNLTSR